MTRQIWNIWMIIFLIVGPNGARAFKGRRNVLLLVVDDLRPALGAYGDPLAITPNIDKLSAISYRMENAHCQFALCGPSRTSFLTSRHPEDMHVVANRNLNWRQNWQTKDVYSMPQYFKENNYRTKSIGKIFHHFARKSGTPDDYPHSWTDLPFIVDQSEIVNVSCPVYNGGSQQMNLLCAVNLEKNQLLPDMKIAKEAQEYLSLMSTSNQSFFLGVGFHKPHIPFHIPRQYLDLHDLNKFNISSVNSNRTVNLPSIAWNPWMDVKKRDDIKALDITFPFGRMPSRFTKYIRHHYYAAVTYVDDLIGQILDALVQSDLADNTIVTLIGDHGWTLGENREWSKFSNYKTATRVPWLMHIPSSRGPKLRQQFGNDGGSSFDKENDRIFQQASSPSHRRRGISEEASNLVITKPIQLLDLFPTLVHKTGLPRLKKCNKEKKVPLEKVCTEGKSLFEEEDRESWSNLAYSQYPRPSIEPSYDSDQPKIANYMGYSVNDKNFRATIWTEFNSSSMKGNFDRIIAEELYDHRSDPLETKNVAEDPKHKKTLDTLSMAIRRRFDPPSSTDSLLP